MKKILFIFPIIVALTSCHNNVSKKYNQDGLDIINKATSQNNQEKIITENDIISKNKIQWGTPNNLNDNSLSQQELSQGKYFLALVSEVEGYRPYIYNDNKGYAIGMGWNISMQSKKMNSDISDYIGLQIIQKNEIISLSNMRKIKQIPKDIRLTTQQAFQAVEFMKPQYKMPIKKLIGPGFSLLAPNKQAVLIYHVYKVGPIGAAKYHNLITDVKEFIKNPNQKLNEKIAKDFTYDYTINGQVKQDTRAQLYMASMWLDPNSFNYIISNEKPTNMPSDMPVIAKTFEQKINILKPIQNQINNPIQDTLLKYYKNGQIPNININQTRDVKRIVSEVFII